MALENMNYIVQMAANLAVIATLIFVVLQVRMGLRMMRDQAVRNHNEKSQSVSRAMFEHPDLADLWARSSTAGMAGLTDGERVRFVNFYTYVLRVWEELFIQHREGIMNTTVWKANMRILRDTRVMPGAQEVWAVRRHLFTPDFQAFYDTELPGEEARSLYG